MRSSLRSALVIALSCGLAAAARAQTSMPSADPSVQLQPGDAVRITVWRQPELSGDFAVTASGQIAHPLYRDIRVAGVPMTTVEAQLTQFLRGYVENPRFVVQPLFKVSVSGQVDRPNVYAVSPGTTISQAVAQAGGVTNTGRQDRVRLVRDRGERFVDLTDPRAGSLPVRSGDEIVVGPRPQWFRSVVVPAATIVGAIASLVIAIRRYE
jgi:protein involved in polysaccharide export with SLBB domain